MTPAAVSENAVPGSSSRKPPMVTHFIAGFPDYRSSLDVARGLIAGGAFALEMQIPFSDPSADGPVIESACRRSLEAGFRVEDAFGLLDEIRRSSDIPVFVMSYASLAVTAGVERFARRVKAAGADGIIVPDLAPGADEGLFAAAFAAGCPAVPVVVPSISRERLDEVVAEPVEWIYVALRSGITGSYTRLGDEQSAFLGELRDRKAAGGPRVMAGFGIQTPEQVEALVEMTDAVVVGSALVRAIASAKNGDAGEAVRALTVKLRGLTAPNGP